MADAVRELRLRVLYEAEQATSASKAWHDGERGRIRSTSQEQEKADAAYVRAMRARLAAEKQLETESIRGIRAAEKARSDAAREANSLLKQAARDEERAARQVAAERKKADRDVFQQWKAEQDMRHAESMRAWEAEQKEAADFKESIKGIGGSFVALAGAAGTFAGHFDKIRTDAFHAAEDVMRMRSAVRELQALRDQMGQTGPGVAHVMEGASQTLLRPEEFQQLESAGLGVGELAIKDDKDRAQFDKAMVAAGRMAAMEGGDPGAYGQMMGQIALQAKGPLDAETMEAQANRLYEIQKPGGFKDMTQALKQYSGLNAYVMNGIYSPEQAMGLASAFSVSSPDEAGTRSEQFTRAVMAGRLRSRGMAVAKDVDMVKSDQYFKSIGIKEEHSAMERGDIVAADLKKQEGAAAAAGKKFNAVEYLMRHGFVNQQDALAIMDYAGLKNTGRLGKIEDAMGRGLDRGAVTRRFDERRRDDPLLRGRETEALERSADVRRGLEEEPLVEAQRAAFARLKAQGKISGDFEDWKSASFATRGAQDLFFGGYHHQVDAEASRAMSAERRRLGLPANSGFQMSEYEAMKRSAREIRDAGGDVRGDVGGQLAQMNQGIKRLVALEERKQQGRAAEAMPNARPPAPRGR
jgi:hypothetical protein